MTKSRANLLSALPANYTPVKQDVICAKGKEAKNHPGNLVLRALIRQYVEDYKNCNRRKERAFVVSKIMGEIKNEGGRFVRRSKGSWADIGSRNTREKIGAGFRDILHDQYRSSAKAKAQFRRQQEENRSSESIINTGLVQSKSFESQEETNTGPANASTKSVSDSESEKSDGCSASIIMEENRLDADRLEDIPQDIMEQPVPSTMVQELEFEEPQPLTSFVAHMVFDEENMMEVDEDNKVSPVGQDDISVSTPPIPSPSLSNVNNEPPSTPEPIKEKSSIVAPVSPTSIAALLDEPNINITATSDPIKSSEIKAAPIQSSETEVTSDLIKSSETEEDSKVSKKENTGRWQAEEHEMFLKGLKEHGKQWKKITLMIKTRSVVQVRTHAQKYFQKLLKNDKKRGRSSVTTISTAANTPMPVSSTEENVENYDPMIDPLFMNTLNMVEGELDDSSFLNFLDDSSAEAVEQVIGSHDDDDDWVRF